MVWSCSPAVLASAAQVAVQLVCKHTSAAGAYVAAIVEEEEPDWAPGAGEGEDGGEGGDGGGGGAETDDEAEGPSVVGSASPTADSAGGDGEAAAEGQGGELQDTEAGAANAAAPTSMQPQAPNYASKLLSYVAAGPEAQAFVTKHQLRRPKAPTDGEADDATAANAGQQQQQAPVTFRVLDERLPLLQVPSVSREPRMHYLRPGFPTRVGGYVAAAVPLGPGGGLAGGAYQAVLAADSLLPEGHGQALGEEAAGFVWEVAQALGKVGA